MNVIYDKKVAGFTLFEIVVVTGLIALLGGTLGLALWSEGKENQQALRTSQGTAATLLRTARLQAIMQNTEARFIIHNDESDPDKKLRYLGLIYKNPENPDGEEWFAPRDGVLIPTGVYFDQNLSGPLKTMQISFPRRRAATGTGETWYYYEFRSDGTAALNTAGARIVFSFPSINGESSEEHKLTGIIIHKLGSFSLITEVPLSSSL